MFSAGCRSPSCLAAEEQDILRQFSAGRHAIFNIIDRPFHTWSLAYLIRAMPVIGVGDMSLEGCSSPSCPAAEESASFFLRAEMPFLIIDLYIRLSVTGDLIPCRQTFELNSTVAIAASLHCYLYR